MAVITKEQFMEKAKELYGENTSEWKFKCPNCKREQSAISIRADVEKGITPQRYPDIKKGDEFRPEQECFSPDCNWVAYGLFNSGLLVVIDDSKPHDSNLKKNCVYVFPFADYEFE